MSDRELLEKAAKAAGIELWHEDVFTNGLTQKVSDNGILCWNPLWKDDDALRLAVKLGMNVYTDHGRSMAEVLCNAERDYESASENHDNDANAATRRAIVRVAAYQEKNNGN